MDRVKDGKSDKEAEKRGVRDKQTGRDGWTERRTEMDRARETVGEHNPTGETGIVGPSHQPPSRLDWQHWCGIGDHGSLGLRWPNYNAVIIVLFQHSKSHLQKKILKRHHKQEEDAEAHYLNSHSHDSWQRTNIYLWHIVGIQPPKIHFFLFTKDKKVCVMLRFRCW